MKYLIVKLARIGHIYRNSMEEKPDNIRGKDFYNELISTDAGIYGAEPEDIAYYPLWEWLMKRINGETILDIGCGTGRLAKLLTENRNCEVIGVDFSDVAISKAKVYAPKALFLCLDIEDCNYDFFRLPINYNIIIFSEILEHIKDDLKLIESIPVDKYVFLTVPNFGCIGHTRWFSSLEDVIERYKEVLTIIDSYNYNNWFIIGGIRNGSSSNTS